MLIAIALKSIFKSKKCEYRITVLGEILTKINGK